MEKQILRNMDVDRTAVQIPATEIIDGGPLTHLAQVLAHRLRSLVAGIEGYTDLLVDTLDSADQRELAMKILEGTTRIEGILADLQLYGASREPALLPLKWKDVMRDLLAPLAQNDAERISIIMDRETADLGLKADPFLLRQALLVLLQNALEATPDKSSVLVESIRLGEQVCIHVRNGGTIDIEAAEEAVFVPFYTTKAHNLGVGLTMARRIAELHDGTLELTSNSLRDGTCFTLSLPQPDETDLS